MDFSLTAEQEQLRASVLRFARERLSERALERDRRQEFSRDLWKSCGAHGLLGLCASAGVGGLGLDPLSTALALEALGQGCLDGGLVFSVAAQLLTAVVPLEHFGSEEQQRRYLPALCRGDLIGAGAMTEPGAGSDAFALSTRAVEDGDGFRLTGAKLLISNVPLADLVIVYARTEPGRGYFDVSAFLVETATAGVTARGPLEKMGLRSSPLGEIVLDEVVVPKAALLGARGAGGAVFTHSMDWERVCLFAAHVGTMQRLLEQSVEHARTRRLQGQPIGSFQAVAHRLADMKVRLEAARLLVYRAAAELERTKHVPLAAAIAKLFVSEAYVQTALDSLQLHGGYGYLSEGPVERSLRDALASTIYSGTSEIQRNIIARWLGL